MSKGYVNGSDLLLMVGEKCVGHCTSHSVTYNSETKDVCSLHYTTSCLHGSSP